MQLDTGSSGLRLLKSELYSSLNLPQVTNTAGTAIGECAAFVIGTTWGSVRYADIYLNGEVAKNVPFQDIGDTPGGATAVPTDCASYGMLQNTQAQLGSKGILGIGLFQNDCEYCEIAAPPLTGAYYTCTASGCANSDVTAAQVVQNPVADFAQDNNGTQINLPAVSSASAYNSLTGGTLIFGIGTQTNNGLGSATVFATDQYGNIITTYKGVQMTGSYIDSGSNALFFNDPAINPCSTNRWAYCPTPSPMYLSATNAAATGAPPSSGTVNFSIVGTDTLSPGAVAANIGGPYGGAQEFDWGLSFFFGRAVFTAISGASTPAGPGPYFAY